VSVKAVRAAAGYSLVEVMLVGGIMAIVAAIAVPTVASMLERYALNNVAQQLAATVRSARYTAVSKNKWVRVRFDCPAANQYRMIEFVANSTVDEAADRCALSAYPYPDANTAMVPDVDGPVVVLPTGITLGTTTDIQIDPQGRMQPLTGCPTCVAGSGTASIGVESQALTQTLTVDRTGRVDVGDPVAN
jgi:type II secretion system protein H